MNGDQTGDQTGDQNSDQNNALNGANATFTLDVVVRFAETDAMGVVHHGAYVIWFEAARVAWMAAMGIPYAQFAAGGHHFAVTGMQIGYRRNCRFGDPVQVRVALKSVRSRQVAFAYEVFASGVLIAEGVTEHICVDLDGRSAKIPAHVMDVLMVLNK